MKISLKPTSTAAAPLKLSGRQEFFLTPTMHVTFKTPSLESLSLGISFRSNMTRSKHDIKFLFVCAPLQPQWPLVHNLVLVSGLQASGFPHVPKVKMLLILIEQRHRVSKVHTSFESLQRITAIGISAYLRDLETGSMAGLASSHSANLHRGGLFDLVACV
jgi:hypothetical protein